MTAKDIEDAVRNLPLATRAQSAHAEPGNAITGLHGMLDKVDPGDCRKILPKIPDGSVDAIITDAPYGVGQGRWDVMNQALERVLVRHRTSVEPKIVFSPCAIIHPPSSAAVCPASLHRQPAH